MTKAEKAQMINKAITRSNWAISVEAKAEITEDGRIQYSMITRPIRPYRIRVSFRKIMSLLQGQDIRAIIAATKA